MYAVPDKILIIEETGFLRVCSSMLEAEGFRTETITSVADDSVVNLEHQDPDLVITSYPHGSFIFEKLKKLTVPVIVLSDNISEEIINLLEGFKISYCMTKPLDYMKFKKLVRELMKGEHSQYAGYSIL
jgi:DNA-binding response OmpR family regulator